MLAIYRKYPSVFGRYFKVDPKQVTLAQARVLATRYPVFRIEIAAVDRVQGRGNADEAPTPMRDQPNVFRCVTEKIEGHERNRGIHVLLSRARFDEPSGAAGAG